LSDPVPAIARTAQQALNGDRHAIANAVEHCPDEPGLYAVYGARETWVQLGLERRADDTPLYVGKAEDSLVRRDLSTHFSTGKTGSSTLRRTFAALLRDTLGLRAVPRNVKTPAYFANYALERSDDQRLSDWMSEHLTIAFWPAPASCVLDDVETHVLATIQPPLNLAKIARPSIALRRARARMADDAREWARSRGFDVG
jgi:hypothetical protein